MKVIKKGRPQKGWAAEYDCTGAGNGGGGCGARLLVEAADVFQTSSYCRDDTDHYTTFECPQCSVLTDIKGCPLTGLITRSEWMRIRSGEQAQQYDRDGVR